MTRNRKSVEQMQAERRELDRQIRAAKRAEAKAAKAALQSERQALGVWLATSIGADTTESVQRLRAALESGQIQHHLRQQITTRSPDSSDRDEDVAGGDHHDGA